MVASFGYRKERDGSRVKKGVQPNDDEGHFPVEGDSSLLQSILDRFDGLQTYVGERFDSLELHHSRLP